MAVRLPDSPTPENFRDAVVELLEPIVVAIAGGDRRIMDTEIRNAVPRNRITVEDSELAAETIRRQLKKSGAKRPTVGSTLEGIGRRALRAGKRATHGDNRISGDDAARSLPRDLARIFEHLRHPPAPAKPKKRPPQGNGQIPALPPPAGDPALHFEDGAPTTPVVLGRAPDAIALESRPLSAELGALLATANERSGRPFTASSYTMDAALLRAIVSDAGRLASFCGQLLTDPRGEGHPDGATALGAQAEVRAIGPREAVGLYDEAVYGQTKRDEPDLYLEWSPFVQPLSASVSQNFNFGAQGQLLLCHWYDGDETRYEGLVAVNPETGALRSLVMAT